MPEMLDIFNADAFKVISMTDAVNKLPYVPGRVGRLGLFSEMGVTTPTITIEEQDGALALVQTSLRGAPPVQNKSGKRTARSFAIPHLQLEDHILADEVAGIRGFGGTELQTVQNLVDQKMAEIRRKLDATVEYHKAGAVKGLILDADGATLYNLFTEFGVSQTSIDFVLGTSTTNIKDKVLQIVRAVEDALGADVYERIHVLCGKDWFTKFITHAEVKAAYDRYQEGAFLRADNRRGFEFAGVTFEEYRGKVGATSFIADAEAYAFPVGVPGLFRTYFAPANYVETVNTLGVPYYAKMERMRYDRGVDLMVQTNPLSVNTRPKTSVKLTTSN